MRQHRAKPLRAKPLRARPLREPMLLLLKRKLKDLLLAKALKLLLPVRVKELLRVLGDSWDSKPIQPPQPGWA